MRERVRERRKNNRSKGINMASVWWKRKETCHRLWWAVEAMLGFTSFDYIVCKARSDRLPLTESRRNCTSFSFQTGFRLTHALLNEKYFAYIFLYTYRVKIICDSSHITPITLLLSSSHFIYSFYYTSPISHSQFIDSRFQLRHICCRNILPGNAGRKKHALEVVLLWW